MPTEIPGNCQDTHSEDYQVIQEDTVSVFLNFEIK